MNDPRRRTVLTALAAGTAALAAGGAAGQDPAGGGDFYVIAEIVSMPETADRLRELLVPFAASSATEPGCLEYTLMEVESEPGRFLTFERWTDRAALEVHMTTPEITALVGELDGVLAKPFTQIFLGDPLAA